MILSVSGNTMEGHGRQAQTTVACASESRAGGVLGLLPTYEVVRINRGEIRLYRLST
jgi:hypothetical protein